MQEDFYYRVMIFQNGKEVRRYPKRKRQTTAYNFYHQLLEKSDNVIFPKKYVLKNNGDKKIIRAKYEIAIVTNNYNVPTNVVNIYGDEINVKTNKNNFIIEKSPFFYEETFYSYVDKKRLTYQDIENKIVNYKETYFILKFFNKLLIYNLDDMQVYLCKNKFDCNRLYKKLFNKKIKENNDHLIFMGNSIKKTRSYLKERILNVTGLSEKHLYDDCSKP
jgi:hypothetical protein